MAVFTLRPPIPPTRRRPLQLASFTLLDTNTDMMATLPILRFHTARHDTNTTPIPHRIPLFDYSLPDKTPTRQRYCCKTPMAVVTLPDTIPTLYFFISNGTTPTVRFHFQAISTKYEDRLDPQYIGTM